MYHNGEKKCDLYTLVVQLPCMPAVAPTSHFCTLMTVIILLLCAVALLIGLGKYITKFLGVHATRLTPHQRNKAQQVLNKAKTNMTLKGKSQPDGGELWRLLTNPSVMTKVMKVPSRARAVVEQMSVLLNHMHRWEFQPEVFRCAGVAKLFQRIICPRVRSPYLLWLGKDAKRVFTSLHPWGAAMFCGDIADTINYIRNDGFLGKSARGGGGNDVDGNDKRLLNHAHERAFLYKELPRRDGWPNKDHAIHLPQLADGVQSSR